MSVVHSLTCIRRLLYQEQERRNQFDQLIGAVQTFLAQVGLHTLEELSQPSRCFVHTPSLVNQEPVMYFVFDKDRNDSYESFKNTIRSSNHIAIEDQGPFINTGYPVYGSISKLATVTYESWKIHIILLD
jgi:hypothetical protein